MNELAEAIESEVKQLKINNTMQKSLKTLSYIGTLTLIVYFMILCAIKMEIL